MKTPDSTRVGIADSLSDGSLPADAIEVRRMLQRVAVGSWSLDAYAGVVPEEILVELRELAGELKGARVLHISATPYGGGVSELLRSAVPLLNDLGLSVQWSVMPGRESFFHATKALHNGLQGSPVPLTTDEQAAYLDCSHEAAVRLEDGHDFIVVHDPQPAALLSAYRGHTGARWVWRCHIDTSEPNPEVWEFLAPLLAGYDAAVFTMRDFVPPEFPVARVETIPPAIDPLSPKNFPLADQTARQILDWIGIDPSARLVTQVSRFDLWKDPIGVIDAYRMVREETSDLQLALVGSMALDDPEGWQVYREVSDHAGGDPRIHLYTNFTGASNVEVNAFQRMSDVVVQKSIREGFGLVVSESLWKETPVVAGHAGGIPMQMPPVTGGILISTVQECAGALTRLLEERELARELGRSGREHVRQRFLLPRLLRDEMRLFSQIAGSAHPAARAPAAQER